MYSLKKIPVKYQNLLIILVSFFIAGIFRWTVSYKEIDGNSNMAFWAGAAFVTGIILGLMNEQKTFKIIFLISVGFTLAVLARIIFDITFVDPTSHNMMIFELILWFIMAFVQTFFGAFTGNFILRLFSKNKNN